MCGRKEEENLNLTWKIDEMPLISGHLAHYENVGLYVHVYTAFRKDFIHLLVVLWLLLSQLCFPLTRTHSFTFYSRVAIYAIAVFCGYIVPSPESRSSTCKHDCG